MTTPFRILATMRRSGSIPLLVLALVLVGCNGDSEADAEDAAATFFGWDSDPESSAQQMVEIEIKVEEAIRTCMAEKGFDYIPSTGGLEVGFAEESNNLEYAEERGFGVVATVLDPEVVDTGWVDPNEEMLNGLSRPERDAWHQALNGTEEEWAEGAIYEVDPETGETYRYRDDYGPGCRGLARTEVYGDPAVWVPLQEQLDPLLDDHHQAVRADPRIIALNEEWARCMREQGYEVSTVQEFNPVPLFESKLEAILGPEYWFLPEEADTSILAALATLQTEERNMAVANLECMEGYRDSYREVSAEYEVEFAAENLALIEQINEAGIR